jgi:hypothetical protein
MEPRGRNRWQVERSRKRRQQAETVAVGCHRLPKGGMVRKGVDGSSPSEGLQRAPQPALLSFRSTCSRANVEMEPFMELSGTRGAVPRRAT